MNLLQFMQHFDGLLYDHIGGSGSEGAAADFISSFDVQMLGCNISRGAVAVRYNERMLKGRGSFNRHSDFRQDFAAEADKGNVTDSRSRDIK
jgi:hypothetical protein